MIENLGLAIIVGVLAIIIVGNGIALTVTILCDIHCCNTHDVDPEEYDNLGDVCSDNKPEVAEDSIN